MTLIFCFKEILALFAQQLPHNILNNVPFLHIFSNNTIDLQNTFTVLRIFHSRKRKIWASNMPPHSLASISPPDSCNIYFVTLRAAPWPNPSWWLLNMSVSCFYFGGPATKFSLAGRFIICFSNFSCWKHYITKQWRLIQQKWATYGNQCQNAGGISHWYSSYFEIIRDLTVKLSERFPIKLLTWLVNGTPSANPQSSLWYLAKQLN